MLGGSTEENVITALCWNDNLAPHIAASLTPSDFSTQVYRKIARAGFDYLEKYREPAKEHLRDLLEDEIKRGPDGKFMDDVLTQMARLAPSLKVDYVRDTLDGFVETQRMINAVNEAIELLYDGDRETARPILFHAASLYVGTPKLLWDPYADEPEPPPFDIDILPPHGLREWVRERSLTMGADPAGLAMAGLAVCSGTLPQSLRLQLKRHDPKWCAPPGLWVLLLGESSTGRTPILANAWEPLKRLQNRAFATWQNEFADWQRLTKKEQERKSKPQPVRFVIEDTNGPKAQDILATTTRGLAHLVDEASGMIGLMTGKGQEAAERAFWLQTYDYGSGSVDRVGPGGRGVSHPIVFGERHIAHLSSIQPSRLRKLHGQLDLTSDGYLQRYVPVWVRQITGGRDDPIGRELVHYESLIEHLVGVEGGRTFILTREALRIRERLDDHLDDLARNPELGDGFRSYVGKLKQMFGSLTLTLAHLIEPEHLLGQQPVIAEEAAALADRLVREQALTHGALFYQWLGGSDGNRELTLAISDWLISEERTRITAVDFKHNVFACRKMNLRQIQEAASQHVAGEWLIPVDNNPKGNKWDINQKVVRHPQFAERALRVKAQRVQIHAIIRGAHVSPPPAEADTAAAMAETVAAREAAAEMHKQREAEMHQQRRAEMLGRLRPAARREPAEPQKRDERDRAREQKQKTKSSDFDSAHAYNHVHHVFDDGEDGVVAEPPDRKDETVIRPNFIKRPTGRVS